MPTCSNCGGSYRQNLTGISGGMMSGPLCRCSNRSTNAAPRRPQARRSSTGISGGMSMQSFQAQRSYQQQRVQGQSLSTTTDSVPFGLGIAIGLVLGVVLCLGFVFIFQQHCSSLNRASQHQLRHVFMTFVGLNNGFATRKIRLSTFWTTRDFFL